MHHYFILYKPEINHLVLHIVNIWTIEESTSDDYDEEINIETQFSTYKTSSEDKNWFI